MYKSIVQKDMNKFHETVILAHGSNQTQIFFYENKLSQSRPETLDRQRIGWGALDIDCI